MCENYCDALSVFASGMLQDFFVFVLQSGQHKILQGGKSPVKRRTTCCQSVCNSRSIIAIKVIQRQIRRCVDVYITLFMSAVIYLPNQLIFQNYNEQIHPHYKITCYVVNSPIVVLQNSVIINPFTYAPHFRLSYINLHTKLFGDPVVVVSVVFNMKLCVCLMHLLQPVWFIDGILNLKSHRSDSRDKYMILAVVVLQIFVSVSRMQQTVCLFKQLKYV